MHIIDYVDPQGKICTGRVQLYTQSNVNYCRPDIGVTREWQPWETKHAIGTTKARFALGRPTAFKVFRGTPIVVDTNDPPGGKLNGDCITLLGLEAIQALGIDLNYHARFDTHKRVKYLYSVEELSLIHI